MEANPVLLEPIVTLKVIVPDEYTGDVMGDLNKRRGKVSGMNPIEGGFKEIVCDIPYIELYEYDTKLYSMTKGSGVFSYENAGYEQAPADIAQKQIDAAKNK